MTGHITDSNNPRSHQKLTPRQPSTGPAGVTLTQRTVATVHELLALADEFLRTASPAVHTELRAYLNTQVPPPDTGWFIDLLGFNATHLARHLPTPAPTPREAWTRHPGAEIHDDKWGQNT
jgi:hypothetical protein